MEERPPRGHLSHLVRYPVKGLSGVETESAELQPGRGLRYDRSLAIWRAFTPEETPTGWNPRETYFHLARDEQIALLRTAMRDAESDDAVLTLGSPDGRAIDMRLRPDGFHDDRLAGDALIRDLLPAGPLGEPVLSRTGENLWDWPQAHLSIINLATVRALGEAAGAAVDPRRFRGNLYLDLPEPWEELSYLGGRIQIGEAVLEIVQPTDRCRATTIDPGSAESNLNVPALLARKFGHLFCGVYARVVAAGQIRKGDPIERIPKSSPPIGLPDPTASWPRVAYVTSKRAESSAVVSLWLKDPLGLASGAVPGQHVRLMLAGESAPAWRCYTISAVRDRDVRISVKRDGRISQAIHDTLNVGSEVILTGPFGDVVLKDEPGDVLFVSAGVGITPTAAMLQRLATDESGGGRAKRVRVVHIDRMAADVALWREVQMAGASLIDSRLRLFLTRERPEIAEHMSARIGRPDEAAWRGVIQDLDLAGLTVYACGPGTFPRDVRNVLTNLGVADERIESEVFFSPTSADMAEPRRPSSTGPHIITIGDETVTWTDGSGSVLDALEACGIAVPSGCRAGVCSTCAQTLASGDVEYLVDPLVSPAPGTVLVCCSAPTSHLELASRTAPASGGVPTNAIA